uniref:Uncharacterized protein n=1 Tax=Cannabis sativa TaxID=3483 RepID=A0A803PFQ1_CANSA
MAQVAFMLVDVIPTSYLWSVFKYVDHGRVEPRLDELLVIYWEGQPVYGFGPTMPIMGLLLGLKYLSYIYYLDSTRLLSKILITFTPKLLECCELQELASSCIWIDRWRLKVKPL